MKLAILAAALLLPASAPAPDPAPAAPGQAAVSPPNGSEFDPMNVHRDAPGCRSILRQVQEESKSAAVRRDEARTLDREPMAHAFLAVDRHVGGCRQVTFLRRNVAPDNAMRNPAPEPR